MDENSIKRQGTKTVETPAPKRLRRTGISQTLAVKALKRKENKVK